MVISEHSVLPVLGHIDPYVRSDKYLDGYSKIVTRIKPLKTYKDRTEAEVELVTGKTHQIRAHLAFIGLPIIGDRKIWK